MDKHVLFLILYFCLNRNTFTQRRVTKPRCAAWCVGIMEVWMIPIFRVVLFYLEWNIIKSRRVRKILFFYKVRDNQLWKWKWERISEVSTTGTFLDKWMLEKALPNVRIWKLSPLKPLCPYTYSLSCFHVPLSAVYSSLKTWSQNTIRLIFLVKLKKNLQQEGEHRLELLPLPVNYADFGQVTLPS